MPLSPETTGLHAFLFNSVGSEAGRMPEISLSGDKQQTSSISDLQLPNGPSGVRERKVYDSTTQLVSTGPAEHVTSSSTSSGQASNTSEGGTTSLQVDAAKMEEGLLSGEGQAALNPLHPFYVQLKRLGYSDEYLHNVDAAGIQELIRKHGRPEAFKNIDTLAASGGVLGESMQRYRKQG